MKKYVRRLISTLQKQNRGSSIVIVIVAIAFVAILGATIMWMSLSNYQMKITDAKHKESFYSAETVFEQITAGLQEDASAAANEAYIYVMQRYASLNESERNYEFQTRYIDTLQKKLADVSHGGTLDQFKLDRLLEYVDPVVMDNQGGTLTRTLTSSCKMVNKSTYLVLEDLKLEYEDEAGFLAVITTNLVISVPEGDFIQSISMPEVFEYCLIANQKLENPDATGIMTINGNVYGGRDGMDIYNNLTIQNAKQIVTDGTITLQSAVDKDIENPTAARDIFLKVGHANDEDIPSLWADNLLIKGGTVDLYAKTYIADDIQISGRNTNLKLQQEYYGYGNSTSDEKSSSAIIINNVDNTIDMSELDKLLLAGHAYISASRADEINPETTATLGAVDQANVDTNSDILMGESIAVKGDQIAYLIPDECIGILDGKEVIGRNPMSGEDYTKLLDYQKEYPETFKEVDFDKLLSITGNTKTLRPYDSAGEFKKIFCPVNNETMVYYYMVMSPEKANDYFRDFYGYHKEKLDRYFNLYASGGIKANAFTRVNVQGNFLTSEAGVNELGVAAQTVSMNEAQPEEEVLLAGECAKYTDTFSALKTKLITNYNRISDKERSQTVFENIIKQDALEAFCTSGTVSMALNDGSGVTAIITKHDYTYGSSSPEKTRLIIAKGNVDVEKNFTGLIIAGGKIKLHDGASVISSASNGSFSEKEELKQILQCKYNESASSLSSTVETKPIELFVNGSSYVLDGAESYSDDTTVVTNIDVTKLVRYENWTKR